MEILLLLIAFGLGGLATTVLLFTIQSDSQLTRPDSTEKDVFFKRVQANVRRFR